MVRSALVRLVQLLALGALGACGTDPSGTVQPPAPAALDDEDGRWTSAFDFLFTDVLPAIV